MYTVLVEDRASEEIQKGMEFYDEQVQGLGARFKDAVDKEFSALAQNPFYQIRYNDIRCKPVKKFPFLIHFQVNETEKIVLVFAVIGTSTDPDTKWLK